FTVFELLVAIGIVALLVALLIPSFTMVRRRAQRIQCSANLRSLHVAAEQYLQDNNAWPQIGLDAETDTGTEDHATAWIAALSPYKIDKKQWICPAIQKALHNPDYLSAGNERVDYMAMPFDDKPMTPHQWPRQPWFVENADVHGHGNLIIFTDGSISDLKSVTGK
ncbi:MAG: type II secretion system protein, partial [Verrucomicrobiota bacterium]